MGVELRGFGTTYNGAVFCLVCDRCSARSLWCGCLCSEYFDRMVDRFEDACEDFGLEGWEVNRIEHKVFSPESGRDETTVEVNLVLCPNCTSEGEA